MSVTVPTALALVGTTLAAIAAFGPFRTKAPVAKPFVVASPIVAAPPPPENPPSTAPAWPTLIEPTAVACDARVRIELADALGGLQSPWSESVLREAQATETHATVRAAIETALRSLLTSDTT